MTKDPFCFSDKTQQYLDRARWNPERCVDTREFEEALAELGCPAFPAVREFLCRFGGLEFSELFLSRVRLSFNFSEFEMACEENVKDYIERIGKSVCLIGEILEFESMLFMDASGKVYQVYPYSAPFLLGNSGEEAIDNFFKW